MQSERHVQDFIMQWTIDKQIGKFYFYHIHEFFFLFDFSNVAWKGKADFSVFTALFYQFLEKASRNLAF